jgi:chorismate dehydratase
MDKIRVGAVSYLNTKPLLFGIHRSPIFEKIELITDYPAKIAESLLDGSIDIGLVPVAIIPKLQEFHIISDYCIGAEGPVASVALFSEQPLEKINRVLLDYQSQTSVYLARILLKHYWKKDVEFLDASEGYQELIKRGHCRSRNRGQGICPANEIPLYIRPGRSLAFFYWSAIHICRLDCQ